MEMPDFVSVHDCGPDPKPGLDEFLVKAHPIVMVLIFMGIAFLAALATKGG
jgi:hypothetical protein